MRALWLLIRAHGDELEGDLGLHQIDLRDLHRPGSGMTLRRVFVLAKALPEDSAFWQAVRKARETAKVPPAQKIRDRAAYYRNRHRRGGTT